MIINMVLRGYKSIELPPAFGDYKNIKNNTKLLYGTTNTKPKPIYNKINNPSTIRNSRKNLLKKTFKPVDDFKYTEGLYDIDR